ncbi:MAG: Unknown protein [uncultured Sulfurovum sp.]|uniref:DUF4136 domain-containing protein n=1 Tax=uncultured Sulfurovum sp. TaxID=269237 RepID=A0A6S6S8R0_9BACT|nr:MAG: Unknown protein [uncultured Sulfurovum sp.]
MNRILLMLLTLSIFIFTTGCSVTPKYKITIDAVTAPNITISPSTYTIKSLNEKSNNNSLLFQHYTAKLANILHQNGYLKTTESAKQFIYFDYGLEKVSEETQTYTEPDISFHLGWGYPYGGYYSPYFNPYYGTGFGGTYNTYSRTRVYYNRYVTLLAKDQLNKELWRVDVSSVGESKNLKKIIPLLLEAASPYLGTNTPAPINVIIKDKPKKK